MYKQTYTININRSNLEEFDPNLETAIRDILNRKMNATRGFDYEIIFMYDGFICNSKFNSCFNAFLHDMIEKPEGYFYMKTGEETDVYAGYVKEFILGYHDAYTEDTNCMMLEVFMNYTSEVDGKGYSFSTPVDIPRERLMGDLSLLQVEPDYLINVVRKEDMFKYVLCNYYRRLNQFDLLDNEKLRTLSQIRIGLR